MGASFWVSRITISPRRQGGGSGTFGSDGRAFLLFVSQLIYRDVASAGSGERRAPWVAPVTPQPHPGQLSHEVQLGRPSVAEGSRIQPDAALSDTHVRGHYGLCERVETVRVNGHEVARYRTGLDALPTAKARGVWDGGLDEEDPVSSETVANSLEALDLRFKR